MNSEKIFILIIFCTLIQYCSQRNFKACSKKYCIDKTNHTFLGKKEKIVGYDTSVGLSRKFYLIIFGTIFFPHMGQAHIPCFNTTCIEGDCCCFSIDFPSTCMNPSFCTGESTYCLEPPLPVPTCPTFPLTPEPIAKPTNSSTTFRPTTSTTTNPTLVPTNKPTESPTNAPTSTAQPLPPSSVPTGILTNDPSSNPTKVPTTAPTNNPSLIPTLNPTIETTTPDVLFVSTANVSDEDDENIYELFILFAVLGSIFFLLLCIYNYWYKNRMQRYDFYPRNEEII